MFSWWLGSSPPVRTSDAGCPPTEKFASGCLLTGPRLQSRYGRIVFPSSAYFYRRLYFWLIKLDLNEHLCTYHSPVKPSLGSVQCLSLPAERRLWARGVSGRAEHSRSSLLHISALMTLCNIRRVVWSLGLVSTHKKKPQPYCSTCYQTRCFPKVVKTKCPSYATSRTRTHYNYEADFQTEGQRSGRGP